MKSPRSIKTGEYKRQNSKITGISASKASDDFIKGEDKAINQVSFVVNVPSVIISQREMASMLSYAVEKYRTAGKTYLIRIGETENEQ